MLPRLLETTQDARAARQVRQALQRASSNRVADLAAFLQALDIKALARRVFVNQEAADDAQASIDGLARAGSQYDSIASFLASLVRHDYEAGARKFAGERLVLSSIEAAKGLEFDTVIVPGVDPGSFAGDSGDDRNLFYVAASRARHLLVLAHRTARASHFLDPYRA